MKRLSAFFSSLFKSLETPPQHRRPHRKPVSLGEPSSDYVPRHPTTWYGF
jgi:hypothetical protein